MTTLNQDKLNQLKQEIKRRFGVDAEFKNDEEGGITMEVSGSIPMDMDSFQFKDLEDVCIKYDVYPNLPLPIKFSLSEIGESLRFK